jgi:hypothetical protein
MRRGATASPAYRPGRGCSSSGPSARSPDTARITVPAQGGVRQDLALRRSAATLTEVVVSAQKRTEVVREVPIAITAWEGEFLRNTGVQEFDQLSQFVPGLNVQLQSPNNPGFVVRGITSDNGDSRVEPRVSVFQDGVSISKSRGSVVELFDLERVEVLKGPQGTLFGRGAQIGAVHLIQNRPVAERAGELRLGTGNFGERFVSAVANAPLGSDRVLGRLAGIYNSREGFLDNPPAGRSTARRRSPCAGRCACSPPGAPWSTSSATGSRTRRRGSPSPPTCRRSACAARPDPFATTRLEDGERLGVDRTVWGATVLATHTAHERLDTQRDRRLPPLRLRRGVRRRRHRGAGAPLQRDRHGHAVEPGAARVRSTPAGASPASAASAPFARRARSACR